MTEYKDGSLYCFSCTGRFNSDGSTWVGKKPADVDEYGFNKDQKELL